MALRASRSHIRFAGRQHPVSGADRAGAAAELNTDCHRASKMVDISRHIDFLGPSGKTLSVSERSGLQVRLAVRDPVLADVPRTAVSGRTQADTDR